MIRKISIVVFGLFLAGLHYVNSDGLTLVFFLALPLYWAFGRMAFNVPRTIAYAGWKAETRKKKYFLLWVFAGISTLVLLLLKGILFAPDWFGNASQPLRAMTWLLVLGAMAGLIKKEYDNDPGIPPEDLMRALRSEDGLRKLRKIPKFLRPKEVQKLLDEAEERKKPPVPEPEIVLELPLPPEK